MRMQALIVVVLGSWIVAADDNEKQDVVKKELKKFEGTWAMVSIESSGVEAPQEAAKKVRMIIKGDKMTIKNGGITAEKTLVLDPSKMPRAYDAKAEKSSTVGIYELDGDTLKVCCTPEGGERPKEFSTKGGTDDHPVMLAVYKRQKAE